MRILASSSYRGLPQIRHIFSWAIRNFLLMLDPKGTSSKSELFHTGSSKPIEGDLTTWSS